MSLCCICLTWPCPSTKTRPGGHEINNFGRPFLGHLNNIHSLLNALPGVEKMILETYCITKSTCIFLKVEGSMLLHLIKNRT